MTEEADNEEPTATTNTAGYGTNGVAVAEVGSSWDTNVARKHYYIVLFRRLGHQRRRRM